MRLTPSYSPLAHPLLPPPLFPPTPPCSSLFPPKKGARTACILLLTELDNHPIYLLGRWRRRLLHVFNRQNHIRYKKCWMVMGLHCCTVNRRRLVRLARDVTKILLFTFCFGHVTNIVHGQEA